MVTTYGSQYVHTAWATDTDGTNFSTTAFDGATCVGTVTDDSSEEITDYSAYTWIELDAYVNGDEEDDTEEEDEDTEENDELEDDDIETDTVETSDITDSDIPDSVDDDDEITSVSEISSDLTNLKMAVSLQADSTTDQIANPNLLSGTNSGADGWTASAGLTIEALSDTVYGDKAIDCLRVTRSTTDAATLFFASDDLSDAISYQAQNYTLSLDFRASNVVVMPISIATSDGVTVGCTFDDIDYTDYADDYASVWVNYRDTATSSGAEATSEGIYIDLSNMAVGDTLDIANLKVEIGSEQTPWRLSAKEAGETAVEALSTAEAAQSAADAAQSSADAAATAASNAQSSADTAASAASTAQTTAETAQSAAEAAQATADNINLHFWYDDDGAHVSQLENDLTGSHTDIVDTGLNVKVGDTTLAAFDSDGITFADSTQTLFEMESGTDTAYEYVYTYLRNPVSLSTLSMGFDEATDAGIGGSLCELHTGDYNDKVAEDSRITLTTSSTSDTTSDGTYNETTFYQSALELVSSYGEGSFSFTKTTPDEYTFLMTVDNAGNLTTQGLVNGIQSGDITLTPTGSKSYKPFGSSTAELYRVTADITFDTPFDAAPIVVVTPRTTVPYNCLASVTDVTDTGFTLYFYRTTQTSTVINWIAIPETQGVTE